MCNCAHLYSLAETPRNPPPPLGSYIRALLVIQDRRHLFVIPCGYELFSGSVGASQARIFIRIFHQATVDVAAANDSSGERRAVDQQQLLPFLPPGISISLAAGGGKAAAAAPVSPGVSPPLGNTPPPAPYFPAKCPTCDKGGRSSVVTSRHA